ncbi:VPLPA-CTERM sorting domain-containing protein [Primorskyibacter sp. 2E107]|uniref:VPLPA-CTERM sorting domain-containing protein n=1 Tax=Primorskyibacter sp. 2E107 TaxID=3403458 RepID=UPI003AF5CAE8
MTRLKFPALLAATIVFGQMGFAATVNPDALESATPGGDYSDTEGAGPNIAPGGILVGETSLYGRLRLNCVAGDCSDTSGLRDPSDAFFATIAADTEITNLTFSLGSETASPSFSGVNFLARVTTPLGFTIDQSFTGGVSNLNIVPALSGASIGPGTYGFYITASDSGPLVDFSGIVNWSMTATVVSTAAVPLPATLPLLLAGMAGFGVIRRKKRG